MAVDTDYFLLRQSVLGQSGGFCEAVTDVGCRSVYRGRHSSLLPSG